MPGLGDYTRYFSALARSIKASDVRELLKIVEQGNVISLAGGLPDPSTFPRGELAAIAAEVLEKHGDKALQYAPTRGVSYFLEAVKEFASKHGVRVAPGDDVIATTGSQEALYLIARAFLDPGDYIVIEEPTYLGMLSALQGLNVKPITVPIDEEGMKTDVLEEKLRRAESEGAKPKLVYTIPTCHNPAGTTMPIERRRHLLELASSYDMLILEDDPYSFITFEECDVKPLKTMDEEGRVIYTSTISKILAPGLRLGWVIAPSPVVSKLELIKQGVDLHTPSFTQFIAAEAMKKGVIDAHIPSIKQLYRKKRDAMLKALEENMPEGARWTRPIGGLFVWVWLPEDINSRRLLEIAIRRGVAFVPGDAFYPAGGGENTMRLNFSYPSVEDIERGVEKIAESIREYRGAH